MFLEILDNIKDEIGNIDFVYTKRFDTNNIGSLISFDNFVIQKLGLIIL